MREKLLVFTMSDPKAISIQDVATAAGVSPTTVSHVVSGKRPVRAETAERVRRAMEQLGYVPNHAAQSLASGSTRTIGLLVPDIANVFFAELAKGVEDAAESLGYSVILGNTNFDPRREARYLDVIRRRAIDALVYAAGAPPSSQRLAALARTFPLGMADEEIPSVRAITVVADHRAGGQQVGALLARYGHRCVLVITGPARLRSSVERLEGFRAGLNDPAAEVHVREGDYRERSAYEIARSLLGDGEFPFTAVFATNDLMAIGVLRALREHGLRVPEDVSVVGYDDIALAAIVTPPLTTVRQPVRAIGTTVAAQLIQFVSAGEMPAPSRHVLDVELVERASAGEAAQRTVHA